MLEIMRTEGGEKNSATISARSSRMEIVGACFWRFLNIFFCFY